MTTSPRLYSKEPRVPVDDIAQGQRQVHADLERWGAWNRERYRAGSCNSLEKNYDSSGGRAPAKSTVALPPDPRLRQIDDAMRGLVEQAAQHAEALKLYYVAKRQPVVICRVLTVNWKDFATWMNNARAMLLAMMGEPAGLPISQPAGGTTVPPVDQQPEQSEAQESLTRAAVEAKAKREQQTAALNKGTAYIVMAKGRSTHEFTCIDGKIARASANVKNMEGWTVAKALDWADRCRVSVYMSDDQGKRGEKVETQPITVSKQIPGFPG